MKLSNLTDQRIFTLDEFHQVILDEYRKQLQHGNIDEVFEVDTTVYIEDRHGSLTIQHAALDAGYIINIHHEADLLV